MHARLYTRVDGEQIESAKGLINVQTGHTINLVLVKRPKGFKRIEGKSAVQATIKLTWRPTGHKDPVVAEQDVTLKIGS